MTFIFWWPIELNLNLQRLCEVLSDALWSDSEDMVSLAFKFNRLKTFISVTHKSIEYMILKTRSWDEVMFILSQLQYSLLF